MDKEMAKKFLDLAGGKKFKPKDFESMRPYMSLVMLDLISVVA
ncbi:MAG: hypothetical protein DGJ47_000994 [Rickettsiaceae bacterium]